MIYVPMSVTSNFLCLRSSLDGRGCTWHWPVAILDEILSGLFLLLLALALGAAGAQAESVGGATKIISQDYAPLRSSIEVDDFGDIYVACDVRVSRTPTPTGVLEIRELRLGRSRDGGATFTITAVASGQTRLPSLAVTAGGNIHIAYLAGLRCDGAQDCRDRPASERASIVVSSSTDGGETFSSPVQVSTPGATNVDWETNIAVDATGKVYVVWSQTDTTDPGALGAHSPNTVLMSTSSDRGQTFSTPVLVHGDPGFFQGEQFIAGNLANANIAVTLEGQVHVTWTNCNDNFCFAYHYRRSLDGQSFSAPLLIDQNVVPYTAGGHDIAVGATGAVSVVYGRDETPITGVHENVYHARIENGVVTSRMNVSELNPEFLAYEPAIAIDRLGTIHVAWSGPRLEARDRSEPHDIYRCHSRDGGHTFSAETNISNTQETLAGSGHSYHPAIAISLAETPLVVWGDNAAFCGVDCFTQFGELHVTLLDSDEDRLPDQWENEGVTIEGVFVDLPKMGADPRHKDIFVHADWMARDVNPPRAVIKPDPRAIKMVTDAFENAPVENPDGSHGVILHVDLGPDSVMNVVTGETWGVLSKAGEVPFRSSVGAIEADESYNWGDVDTVKAIYFDPAKRGRIFHYALFANTLGGISAGGIARGIPGADFLVTLGLAPTPGGTEFEQAGVFMHELGHNLGLRHGGSDDIHRKPNYLSIMNYAFTFIGLIFPDGTRSYDFSAAKLLPLDEMGLDESAGIRDPERHQTVWNCNASAVSRAGVNLDWNCDGTFASGVITDINGDGICVSAGDDGVLDSTAGGDDRVIGNKIVTGPNRTCETTASGDDTQMADFGSVEPRLLHGFDDWSAIVFDGGGRIAGAGAAGPEPAATPNDEPTMEELLEAVPAELLAAGLAAPDDVVTTSGRTGLGHLTVTFDGTASASPGGAVVNWQWDFGDGTEGSGRVVSHTYTRPGRYFARLTVVDSQGNRNLAPLLHRVTVGDLTPWPPPSGTLAISGRVTDEGGNGLVNVTMTLQNGSRLRTAQTDNNGDYSFSKLEAGEVYRVTASKFRYRFDRSQQSFDNLSSDQRADFRGVLMNFRGGANGRIAFASARDSVGNLINFEIYTADSDGSNLTRLTNSPGSDLRPVWSPDGMKLAFVSQRDGNFEIYFMNADGSQPTRMTNNSAGDDAPAWAPDGRSIAFASDAAGSSAIYVMDADGGNVRRVTFDSNSDGGPTWSPDGTMLAFESRRDGDYEIYTINADGTFLRKLTNNESRDQHSAWSPDGTRMAFATNRDGNDEIYVMDADGGNQVRLTDHPALDAQPAWSADGMRIVFDSGRNAARDIYSMSHTGGEISRVTVDPVFASTADWQSVPAPAPIITGFSPTSGLPGSGVTIYGSNFTGAAGVTFNGAAGSLTVDSATELEATVPVGASSGPIGVSALVDPGFSNTDFIVLADSDGDRMADVFEQQYLGGVQGGDPAGDDDGDGATNLEEFQAGTNPIDSESVFQIIHVRRDGGDVVITFQALASRRYRVEASTNLADGFLFVIATTARMTSELSLSVTDPGVPAQLVRFYRVVVLP